MGVQIGGGGGVGAGAKDAWDDHKEKEEITVSNGAQTGGRQV